MKRKTRPRIVVCGAGIAGSLITSGLIRRDDIDLICLERVATLKKLEPDFRDRLVRLYRDAPAPQA